MTLSKRDAKLLLILLGIILLLVGYMVVYNPYTTKTETVQAETAALMPELEELRAHYNNLGAYQAGIDSSADTIEQELRLYPSDVRTEDLVMYAITLQEKVGLQLVSIDFSGAEPLLEFTEITETPAGTVSFRNVTAARSGATITMSLSYQQLKDMIDFIAATDLRTALENVTVTFDSETGELTGDAAFNKYFISGEGDEYTPTRVPSVPLGRDDLFGTVPQPESASEGEEITIIG